MPSCLRCASSLAAQELLNKEVMIKTKECSGLLTVVCRGDTSFTDPFRGSGHIIKYHITQVSGERRKWVDIRLETCKDTGVYDPFNFVFGWIPTS